MKTEIENLKTDIMVNHQNIVHTLSMLSGLLDTCSTLVCRVLEDNVTENQEVTLDYTYIITVAREFSDLFNTLSTAHIEKKTMYNDLRKLQEEEKQEQVLKDTMGKQTRPLVKEESNNEIPTV